MRLALAFVAGFFVFAAIGALGHGFAPHTPDAVAIPVTLLPALLVAALVWLVAD